MSTIQPICAVYDKKTGSFEPPFTCKHVGEAIREWEVITKDEKTKFGKFPNDFELYQIGTFDYNTAEIHTLKPHTHLMGGS